MNKRNAIKELKRIQKVDIEQRMRISHLKEDLKNTQEELNTTQEELNITQEKLNNIQEKLIHVEKVQEQQGIDIANSNYRNI